MTKYRPEQIVAVCYTGSGNYNADCEGSDVDTWALVIEDNYNPATYEVVMYSFDSEVIWFADIRAFINGLSYSDFWYMLPLYSKYKIINPIYKPMVQMIVERREDYAYNNVLNFAKNAKRHAEQMMFYFNKSSYAHTRSKKLYYLCLSFMATTVYKYGYKLESLFYNEKYGSQLKRIKTETHSDAFYNNLCLAMVADIKSFCPTEDDYPPRFGLIEFSQEQITKIFEVYNEYSNKD